MRSDGAPVAIVTGAGSAEGIGFAVARGLVAAGYHVAITSTTDRIQERAAELDPTGKRVSSFVADLTDEFAARDLVEAVLRLNNRIDVLVNNAGMAQTGRPVNDTALQESVFADWKRQIDITLNTAYLMTRAVLAPMSSRRYGRIVNVTSVTRPRVGIPGYAAYGAAKAGIEGMMRAVALETAAHGITVNSVEPGWIATASSTEVERVAGLHTPTGRALRQRSPPPSCFSHPRTLPTSPARRSWSTAATSSRRARDPRGLRVRRTTTSGSPCPR